MKIKKTLVLGATLNQIDMHLKQSQCLSVKDIPFLIGQNSGEVAGVDTN
jgi:hypothetical protein